MKVFKILLYAAILAAAVMPLCAQGQGHQNSQPSASQQDLANRANTKALREQIRLAIRKASQGKLAELQSMLKDYHAGKYTARQGHAILFRLLLTYSVLGSTQSLDCQAARAEYKQLRKEHPEFVKHPMQDLFNIELPSQKAARGAEEGHEQQLKEEAKNFMPTDSNVSAIYGYGNHAVFLYQFKLAFFNLPPEFEVKSRNPNSSLPILTLYRNNQIIYNSEISPAKLGFKPFKVLSFYYDLQPAGEIGPEKFKYFIWACEDVLHDGQYAGSNDNEREILEKRYNNGAMPWVDKSADYKNFCGAISLDGKIIYQLPIKQHSPDTLFNVSPIMNSSGTSIYINVGQRIYETDEDGNSLPMIGKIRELLIYTYPNKLEKYNAENIAAIRKALIEHGFRRIPPWF